MVLKAIEARRKQGANSNLDNATSALAANTTGSGISDTITHHHSGVSTNSTSKAEQPDCGDKGYRREERHGHTSPVLANEGHDEKEITDGQIEAMAVVLISLTFFVALLLFWFGVNTLKCSCAPPGVYMLYSIIKYVCNLIAFLMTAILDLTSALGEMLPQMGTLRMPRFRVNPLLSVLLSHLNLSGLPFNMALMATIITWIAQFAYCSLTENLVRVTRSSKFLPQLFFQGLAQISCTVCVLFTLWMVYSGALGAGGDTCFPPTNPPVIVQVEVFQERPELTAGGMLGALLFVLGLLGWVHWCETRDRKEKQRATRTGEDGADEHNSYDSQQEDSEEGADDYDFQVSENEEFDEMEEPDQDEDCDCDDCRQKVVEDNVSPTTEPDTLKTNRIAMRGSTWRG